MNKLFWQEPGKNSRVDYIGKMQYTIFLYVNTTEGRNKWEERLVNTILALT